jgi:hypothetical protein
MIDIHYHDACEDELFDEYGELVDLEQLARDNEIARDRMIEDAREFAMWSESQRGY